MIVATIILSILFVTSVYVNVTFYKKLVSYEDQQTIDNTKISELLEELANKLASCESLIKVTAGHDVANDDPYIRRVIASLVDSKEAVGIVKDVVESMVKSENAND